MPIETCPDIKHFSFEELLPIHPPHFTPNPRSPPPRGLFNCKISSNIVTAPPFSHYRRSRECVIIKILLMNDQDFRSRWPPTHTHSTRGGAWQGHHHLGGASHNPVTTDDVAPWRYPRQTTSYFFLIHFSSSSSSTSPIQSISHPPTSNAGRRRYQKSHKQCVSIVYRT